MSLASQRALVCATVKTKENLSDFIILLKRGAIALPAALGLLLATSEAKALDLFEIQIYEAEVNRPLQPALEVHTNYTFSGRKTPDYSGEEVPHHAARVTFEPALGITEYLELGAYLQNMLNSDGQYRFAGFKLRTKFVVPKRYTGKFFFGLNAEIGKVPRAVEQEGWANEFRPIIGWYNGYWLFDVNPIFGYALSGKEKFRPDLEPGGKIAYNMQYGFMLGAEYYAGLGMLERMSPFKHQDHLLFVTFDLVEPAHADREKTLPVAPHQGQPEQAKPHEDAEDEGGEWELNLGIGRALTDVTPQQWIGKVIVGRSF